jgi:hypothetical protein
LVLRYQLHYCAAPLLKKHFVLAFCSQLQQALAMAGIYAKSAYIQRSLAADKTAADGHEEQRSARFTFSQVSFAAALVAIRATHGEQYFVPPVRKPGVDGGGEAHPKRNVHV